MQLKAALFLATLITLIPLTGDAQPNPWDIHFDVLGYSDSDATQVLSPQLGVVRALDTEGGALSARFTVDAISSASVDVVSHATRGFREVRYQIDAAASKRFGDHLPALSYRFSLEPDYESHTVGGSLQSRLGTPDSVVSISYALTVDSVQRVDTPSSIFAESLVSHTADMSFTQNLSTRSVLRLAYSLTAQFGYMEKPYRHVSLFRRDTVMNQRITFDNADSLRLSTRPQEALPDDRVRHAIGARLMHYIPDYDLAFRFDYQLYADNWGLVAQTAEVSTTWEATENIAIGLWLRVYQQGAASFWQRTYDGEGGLPSYRTADRDLSPYVALTPGLRIAWQNETFALYGEGSVVQTEYEDFLYLDRLTAVVVQIGVKYTP